MLVYTVVLIVPSLPASKLIFFFNKKLDVRGVEIGLIQNGAYGTIVTIEGF